MLYSLYNGKSSLRRKFKLLLYRMCARPALLYAAPVGAAAVEYRLKTIQITQNKFLRIILNTDYSTRIETFHGEADMEYTDDVIAKLLEKICKHNHKNPFISEVKNYTLADIQIKM